MKVSLRPSPKDGRSAPFDGANEVPSLKRIVAAGICALLLGALAHSAKAETVVPCTADTCKWSIAVGGVTVKSGSYGVDTNTGALDLAPISWSGDGSTASLTLSGNSDPLLGFNFSAGTTAAGNTFSLTLSMPISLSGQVAANSSVSYSLTATSNAGAEIQPLLGAHVVSAQEVSTAVGGPPAFNKGVDVGDTFFFTGGPLTQNSPVYTAANMFALASGNQYNLMSVTVAFGLSAASNVGLSGFVEQTPVPLPSAIWALMSGSLGVFGVFGRRRRRFAVSTP